MNETDATPEPPPTLWPKLARRSAEEPWPEALDEATWAKPMSDPEAARAE